MKKIILYSLALLSISSCTKNTDVIESTTIVYQYISPNYLIKEDFEMGKKQLMQLEMLPSKLVVGLLMMLY